MTRGGGVGYPTVPLSSRAVEQLLGAIRGVLPPGSHGRFRQRSLTSHVLTVLSGGGGVLRATLLCCCSSFLPPKLALVLPDAPFPPACLPVLFLSEPLLKTVSALLLLHQKAVARRRLTSAAATEEGLCVISSGGQIPLKRAKLRSTIRTPSGGIQQLGTL